MKNKVLLCHKKVTNYIKTNKQFCSFIILSFLCTIYFRAITVGNIFSILPIIFDMLMISIIGLFSYLKKPEKQFIYLLICLIVLNIVCIINTIYYTFYSSFASFSLLTALNQVSEVSDAVFEKIRIEHFIYLLTTAAFIIYNKKLKKDNYFKNVAQKTKLSLNKKTKNLITITAIIIVIIYGVLIGKLAKQWNREYIVSNFGIIIYQTNDFINTLKPTISSLFGYDVAYKNFNDYYTENRVSPKTNEYTKKYQDYNIVFIHMESMSSFLINLEIKNEKIAPNLTKLTKEGMYFSNFYPQIGVGTSSDTEFTLNTSLMPSQNGTVFVNYFDRNYVTIPKLLKEKDYYTFSMHANKDTMWNRNKMHPSLGYTDFYSKTSYNIDNEIGLGLSDISFFNQSISILENIEKNNKRYMGTIITLTNHTPFTNDLNNFKQLDFDYELNGKTHEYLKDTKLKDYLISSHYADEALGEFIKSIKKSDYFNNTLFVFYGDHDPNLSLKEYNNYYNYDFQTGKIKEESDPTYINYDYFANELNRKTPLILWTKNEAINQNIDYFMGMIDVMPTIGNMLGIYNKYALGNDIFEIKNDNIIAFPNGNFLTNKVYYRASRKEYKALTLDEVLPETYIEKCKEQVDKIIEVSNGIIEHDLIKVEKEKERK